MTFVRIITYIYLAVLLLSFIFGCYRFKYLDTAAKIYCTLAGLTFIDEVASFYAALVYHNNIPIYNIFDIVEFGLVSLYFNYSNDFFRKYNIGIYIAAIGCALGVGDVFLQSINHINSYFLFFDGITIISMALYSFARIVQKDDELEYKCYPHFWLSACLTFYWSITFFNWGLYDHFSNNIHYTLIINILILFANIITYAGIGTVFLIYPKMQKSR